jgi:post-segregation antitoxin (ccd killing protein)
MPNANRLTVRIMVMVAKDEGLRISARTKAALAAAEVRHEAGPDRWCEGIGKDEPLVVENTVTPDAPSFGIGNEPVESSTV